MCGVPRAWVSVFGMIIQGCGRTRKALSKELRERIRIVGQEYQAADYIYRNNISEVDAYSNKKYQIPKNFYKFDQLKIDGTILYKIFKLKDFN